MTENERQAADDVRVDCDECEGSGRVYEAVSWADGGYGLMLCPSCGGCGYLLIDGSQEGRTDG